MNMFKKLTAILLVAVMFVACFAFNVSAADKAVTVTVGDVEVDYDEAKLSLLADGNTASDATAYSNEGLVSFKNLGFNHDDGVDAAVEATFEIVLDLGEVQTIGSISLDAYKESNSMVALPSVSYYVSVDGENYYQINAGAAVSPAEDAAENAVTTLKADFSTRIAVNAQYVKAVVTFKNGWVFLSELSVGAATEGIEGENPDKAYDYSEHGAPSPGVGIFDSTDGELDLSLNENESGKHFSNSQLIKAAYDADADAYKVIYSKVNPWPDGHTGTETLAEGEILVAIVTNGTVSSDAFSGCKWIARGLTEGDWLVLNEGTITFLPASAVTVEPDDTTSDDEASNDETSDESSEPAVDPKDEYAAGIEALVGEALENPSFAIAMDSVTDKDGVVTVTVTVTDIAEGAELTGLFADLFYDEEKMTLTTEADTENALKCITKVPSEAWNENLIHYDEENGCISIGIGMTSGEVVAISPETPLELTFTFQLNEGVEYAGLYIPTASVSGTDFSFVDFYGNGTYEIAELPAEEEPSEDSKPVTGDAGVLVFAVLGLIAICGAAVVVKVRH